MSGRKIYISCVCALAMLILFSSCKPTSPSSEETPAVVQYDTIGYSYAAYEGESPKGDSFLACGSDGKLDRIYADKTVENIPLPDVDAYLTQVMVKQGITLVGGQSGTLLYSRDGKEFIACETATNSDIVGLAFFKNQYYAGVRDGTVLVSDDGISWKKSASLSSKSIVSFAATSDYIAAISDDTDIFMSSDGTEWDSQNYNGDGTEKLVFTKLVNLSPSFFIIGHYENDPDWPFIMFSDSGGEIWHYKTLDEINDEDPNRFAPLNVNFLCVFAGQLIGVCNDGRLLTIDECSVCNTIAETAEADLRGIALSETNMLIVGDNFEFSILDASDFRQDKIGAEQANEEFLYNGAVIVDVRSKEDYDQSHIKGAIHIPVDEIETRLSAEIPDQNTGLIFYGGEESQAQIALEKALELGYPTVFNLGGLSDWPYETE